MSQAHVMQVLVHRRVSSPHNRYPIRVTDLMSQSNILWTCRAPIFPPYWFELIGMVLRMTTHHQYTHTLVYYVLLLTVSLDTGQCTMNTLTVHIGHCTDVNKDLSLSVHCGWCCMCKTIAFTCGSAEKGQHPRANTIWIMFMWHNNLLFIQERR